MGVLKMLVVMPIMSCRMGKVIPVKKNYWNQTRQSELPYQDALEQLYVLQEFRPHHNVVKWKLPTKTDFSETRHVDMR